MDYDCFGHCVKCHKNMLIEQVVDGELIQRFTPDYSEEEFLLDNGSRMRVVICKDCQKSLTENDYNKIMQCVINGWKKEIENNPDKWDRDKKKKYQDDYFILKIVTKSQYKTEDELKLILKQHKDKKVK